MRWGNEWRSNPFKVKKVMLAIQRTFGTLCREAGRVAGNGIG